MRYSKIEADKNLTTPKQKIDSVLTNFTEVY